MTTAVTSHHQLQRIAFAALAPVLLTAAIVVATSHDTGYWQIFAFGLGPDIALLFGAGHGLQRGQLHPRAVRLYNALHAVWLPSALAAVALVGAVSPAYLVAALAWGFHVALDRAVGYWMRTREGFQRA